MQRRADAENPPTGGPYDHFLPAIAIMKKMSMRLHEAGMVWFFACRVVYDLLMRFWSAGNEFIRNSVVVNRMMGFCSFPIAEFAAKPPGTPPDSLRRLCTFLEISIATSGYLHRL